MMKVQALINQNVYPQGRSISSISVSDNTDLHNGNDGSQKDSM
jgi:hypothetical protein